MQEINRLINLIMTEMEMLDRPPVQNREDPKASEISPRKREGTVCNLQRRINEQPQKGDTQGVTEIIIGKDQPTTQKKLLGRQFLGSDSQKIPEASDDFADVNLSAKELRKLRFNFNKYLSKNPPIDGIFDPETAEKGDDYEQLLVRQEEAMMKCRTLIELFIEKDKIERDSSRSRAKLKKLVDTFGVHYGFTDQQTTFTNDLVDAYYDQRDDGVNLRIQFAGRDRDLAAHVIGMELPVEGKIKEVRAGPFGLEIVADHIITKTAQYRGTTPQTEFVGGALADIYAEHPHIIANGEPSKQTLGHERQHIR
jgi:hypothetical protein